MGNKKKRNDIPAPKKDVRIEPGKPGFKDALVNFVRKTSKNPSDNKGAN